MSVGTPDKINQNFSTIKRVQSTVKVATPSLKELTKSGSQSNYKSHSSSLVILNAPQGRKTESTPTRTVTVKDTSPKNKVTQPHHVNMASVLVDRSVIKEEKESFVHTVLTARQKCDSFNRESRQIEQQAQTVRGQQKSSEEESNNMESGGVLNGRMSHEVHQNR